MASKSSHSSVALILSLNLVLFALVSGTNSTGNCGGQQTCSIDTLKLGFDPGTVGFRGCSLLEPCHKSKRSGNN
ncbi:hypothetical protein KY289_016963 [Solanum tuberosum]|nr:hypothetical protein KY284_016749 [Solanum tuberosum]KAH0689605.1 hypothetical protein KY289_016963 [Solanum tuberosum]